MSEWYTLDFSEVIDIEMAIEMYGQGSGQVIDKVLHGKGARIIKRAIPPHIHPSGRDWLGKADSIAGKPSGGDRLSQDNGNLQVTIAARGRHSYLYFPDDGTNTMNHAGDQQFMRLGAEDQQQNIIDLCIDDLAEKFNN